MDHTGFSIRPVFSKGSEELSYLLLRHPMTDADTAGLGSFRSYDQAVRAMRAFIVMTKSDAIKFFDALGKPTTLEQHTP